MSVYKTQTANGFWKIDRTLAAYFKDLYPVIILDELIFHEMKHSDSEGWFYYNVEEIEKKLFIGEKLRKRCFQQLIDAGILTIEKRGIPCRFWYKINGDKIDEVITKAETSGIEKSGTGNLQKKSASNLQKSGTINKKIYNKIKEEVVVDSADDGTKKTTTNTSSDLEFKELKDYFLNIPYYKRLKAIGAIKSVFRHYGGIESFKSNYERLYSDYTKKKRFPGDGGSKDEAWYHDCYQFIENSILKEVKR